MTQIIVVSNLLPGIADRFISHVVDTTNKAILEVDARATAVVPRDTGALAANKTIKFATAGDPSAEETWNQEYASYVENGTSRMAPQPYAGPAVDAVTPGYLAALADLGL